MQLKQLNKRNLDFLLPNRIVQSTAEDENKREEKWGKAIKEIARQNKALCAFNEQEKQKIQKHSAKTEM